MSALGTVGVMRGVADRITDADDVVLGMLGFAQEDLKSGRLNWPELTPPEFLHLDQAGMKQALARGGFTVPYQKEFFHKNGSRVPVLLVCAFVPGVPDAWIGYVVNLSHPAHHPLALATASAERQDTASSDFHSEFVSELVRERQRMIAMLNNTEGLIWAVDADCRLHFANRAFQVAQRRFSGVELDSGESVLSPQFEEDVAAQWRSWYARALAGERFTAQLTNHLGTVPVYSEHLFSPMIDEGKRVVGVTVMSQDVSTRMHTEMALRSSEARFRTIATQSPLGVFLTDAQGRFVYANPRLQNMWGLSESEIMGDGYLRAVHPDDRRTALEELRVAMTASVSLETGFRVVRSDGSERHVCIWTAPIRDGETVTGFAGTVDDDTDRRDMATRIRQREKMESLGTLAGGIAHDFNNMLGIVLGHTELAIAEASDPTALQEHLREIHTASARARDLVQQILTFSRHSGREQAPVDLRALVAESLKLLRSAFPVSVAIEAQVTSEPAIVLGDATALQQIIVNLCTNAEHAMRSTGGGTITIALTVKGVAPHGQAMLTVTDTGHGMQPEILARAFEPFFTTKTVGEGTGMGLAVVHGLMTSHGGGIELDSTVGEGTTVRVALPLTARALVTAAVETATTRGSGRVLLVEDEPALARFAERALQRAGYDVRVCNDGTVALEQFRATPDAFDVIVTDLTMPGLPGDRLATELRALRSDIPIVLMTGFSRTITSRNAHEFGITTLLEKPFSAKDLVAVVTESLQR